MKCAKSTCGLVLALLFVASVAHAQPKPIEKCTGNFEEAQMKEKRGKLIEAEELYGLCTAPSCPSMIRADCTEKREEMTRRVPTATIVIRDAAGNDLAAKVSIDGKPLEDRTHAQPIDPGEHTVTYEVEGSPPATQKITAVEGEKARVIAITAKAPEAKRPAQQPAPASQGSEGPALVGPLIVGGVGLVLVGSAVILGVVSLSNDSKAEEFRQQATASGTSAEDRVELLNSAQSRQDAAEGNRTLAIVLGVTGVLFVAGGVSWYFLTKPSPNSKRATFTPAIAPGYAGASFGLAF